MNYPFNVYIGNKDFCCEQQDILDAIGDSEEEIEETLPEQPKKVKRKQKLINAKKCRKKQQVSVLFTAINICIIYLGI